MRQTASRFTGTLIACLIFAANAGAVPAIQEAELDNGLRILLMEAHNVPMVSMQLTLPAGSRFDPPEKGGAATLLAAMMGDHTALHDHTAWGEILDSEAIRLGASTDRDGLSLSLTVLKEALPAATTLFSEALLRPGWNEKRFGILKEDHIAAARKNMEDPGTLAAEATAALLFAGHPYGHRPDGTIQSLERIRLNDLKQIYTRQIKPQGAVLAVSGDITMNELLPLLRPALADWKGAPQTALFALNAATPVHGRRAHVKLPTSQTLVQLARLGPARNDAAFFAAFVLNHILGGGGFGSVLMEEVREKRGMVYGIYSYFVPLAVPGPFAITLQTRADQADAAIKVVNQTLHRLHTGEISEKQMNDAKANLIGSFAQRIDSNRERTGLMSMIGFYNLPPDYLQRWTERVESVTLADVKKAAREYLNPDAWNLIQVGPQQTGSIEQ